MIDTKYKGLNMKDFVSAKERLAFSLKSKISIWWYVLTH